MTIKNLGHRARWTRAGKIRLGVKAVSSAGKEYPKAVDYFVCPPEVRKALGQEQPKRLRVFFPGDEPTQVFVTDYVRYQKTLCTLKCDGETFREWPRDGGERTGPCQKERGKKCACGATASGRLNVVLIDAPIGVYQVMIGGEQGVSDLMTDLERFRALFGRLTGIPFEIERVESMLQVTTDDGKRMAKAWWPVVIRCNFTAAQALKARGMDPLALQWGSVDAQPALAAAAAPAQPALVAHADDPDHEDDAPDLENALEAEPSEEAAGSADEDEWDISMCYKVAAEIGVSAGLYRTYLSTLGADPDGLPPRVEQAEIARMREVKRGHGVDSVAAQAVKAAIIEKANAALAARKR